jgi:3-oxoacyl-[acyl-carrier protein] reductase
MTNALSGKVALVTGGSRGIGAAIVRRLKADGASVAFTYAASEDQAKALAADLETAGGRVLAIKADSADTEAVKQAVAKPSPRSRASTSWSTTPALWSGAWSMSTT